MVGEPPPELSAPLHRRGLPEYAAPFVEDDPQGEPDADLDLLRRFEPILRFNEGELFLPAAVEDYVRCCELFERGPDGRRALLAAKGTLTVDRLVELGRGHPRAGQFLRFVDEPSNRAQVARWRVRGDRPRFRNASRLARVGVLSRGIDALNRASLMFRGKVAGGTEVAAETQYRTECRPDHHPYYGRVVRDGGYTVLQYWYFYVFNDWRSRVFGVNDHEADWEQVTIYLVEREGELVPAWIASSAHDEVGDDLRRRWDDPDLTIEDGHPVVHPGLGSHSGAYVAGEYLTAYEGEAFSRLLRWSRRVSRTLLPWTRNQHHVGLSIPYVDYSRGDGVSIGAGQQRTWVPVRIAESTPWVVDYRGLWGDDTQDPLGGERGPAGPRYERTATVRASWGDPVGWAGLHKVAPDERAARDAVDGRLAELDAELEALDQQIDAGRARFRAVVAGGDAVSPADEQQMAALSSDRVARRDERLVLAGGPTAASPAVGPHDHLRHRRLPMLEETTARRRLLALWSAVSTSFLLAIVVVTLIAPGWKVATIGFESILLLFAIEALARRQLVRFVVLILVVAVAASIALTVGVALVRDWRVVVAVPVALTALALLVINVRELLRD